MRWLIASFMLCVACSQAPEAAPSSAAPPPPPTVLHYSVVKQFPHDPECYTQGLTFDGGKLFESGGQYGRSSLREVELDTGKLKRNHIVPAEFFAEGMTIVGDKIYQLTYKEGQCLVYDKAKFDVVKSFRYEGEGWGLTYDGKNLLMSDGSAEIRVLDPETFKELKRIQVTDGGNPVQLLNELEFVDGVLYANIYLTDRIARIDPTTGRVTGWLDLAGILDRNKLPATSKAEVLNGIAYEPSAKRLFVTGKYWPTLFEIKLVDQP